MKVKEFDVVIDRDEDGIYTGKFHSFTLVIAKETPLAS